MKFRIVRHENQNRFYYTLEKKNWFRWVTRTECIGGDPTSGSFVYEIIKFKSISQAKTEMEEWCTELTSQEWKTKTVIKEYIRR